MSEPSKTSAPQGAHIFVSYARADQARATAVVDALKAAGWEVWWDDELRGGANFAKDIEQALRAAQAVVVLWSAASIESTWVRDEAGVGRDLGRLVPARLDATPLPLGFGQYHAIDLGGWKGRVDAAELQPLLRAVEERARDPDLPQRVRRTAPTPGRGAPRRAVLVGGATAAALAAAAGGWELLGHGLLGRRAAPPRSIAVLPFANLSGDPGQDYFADGITDELIGALARIPSLRVAGRTSSFSFKGSHAASKVIGHELGVAYLLDGSVRREADEVRIAAELIDPTSGFTRWSQNYDRQMKDILATQSGIAEAVAGQLKGALLGSDVAALGSGTASRPVAYDDYLKGRQVFAAARDEAGYRAAMVQFDAATAADPTFAAAHAARARVLLSLGEDAPSPSARNSLAKDALTAARRAVALAPKLGEAQATLADTLATAFLDFAGARAAYARAMASGDGDAGVLARYGLFQCDLGQSDAGLPALRRATGLDPLNPRAFVSLGLGLVMARRYGEAAEPLRRALAIEPAIGAAHAKLGDALYLQGDAVGAAREYALEPEGWARSTGLAIATRKLRDAAGAQAAFAALTANPDDPSYYQQAQVRAQWGEADSAFVALEAAVRARDSGLVLLRADPMIDPLRRDPRLGALLGRLALA